MPFNFSQCRFRWFYRSVMALWLLAGGGCGGPPAPDYSGLDLIDVSGSVALDGAPLANATVRFEASDGSFSFGLTETDGSYRLMFNSEKSGATTGPKIVRITVGSVGEGEADDAEAARDGQPNADGDPAASVKPLPARYNRRSELNVIVDAEHDEFAFDLTSEQ